MNLLSMQPLHFGNRYTIVKHLATGGMAEVYLAHLKSYDGFSKAVVIKKILKPYERDPRWIDSFLNEAKIMALLNHSNIVQIYDSGKSRSGYFLSMEYVDGASLLDIKNHLKILPLKYVLFIGLEILKGLSFAHKRGVLHRDLSPSNILISKEGEIKITDFGVAKLISKSLEPTQFLKGKHLYMSPEQKRRKPLTAASDIYSLSVMLAELLRGDITGDAESLLEKWAGDFSFLKKGLSRNPQDRFKTCEDFEMVLRFELTKSQNFVSQRDLSEYLSQMYFGHRLIADPFKKTLRLPTSLSSFGRSGKNFSWRRAKWMRLACLIALLGSMGGWGVEVPAFYPHGYLSINVNPWGEVMLARKPLGITPLMYQQVPTGHHQVIVTNPLLQKTKQLYFEIKRNSITKINVVLY